jgi:hypothetical protein
MPNVTILDERAKHYGPVGPNIERIAALWSAYLGSRVTAHDVGWMMVLLKCSRSRVDPNHLDNYEDAHGYVGIAEAMRLRETFEEMEQRRKESFE